MPAPGDDPAKITRYHNVFWFDPETMEPLINTPGHVKALEMLTELTKAGPSAMVGWELGKPGTFSCGVMLLCALPLEMWARSLKILGFL